MTVIDNENARKLRHTSICYIRLVPSMRLELIRLSSPPPQDGVSTNFTTKALFSTFSFVSVFIRTERRHSTSEFDFVQAYQ